MAAKPRDALGVEALDVLADRGYFSGEEILACEPLGVLIGVEGGSPPNMR